MNAAAAPASGTTTTRAAVWISAGETSGDERAAELWAALKAQRHQARAFGIAGPRMRAAGVDTVVDIATLRGIGIAEAARTVPAAAAAIARGLLACARRRPQVAVLVDYGEFHLWLGAALRGMGIPVFHLAPPKLWAWGTWRVARLRHSADALGVLFPFETDFYAGHGFRVVYVGHPAARWLDEPTPAAPDRLLLLPGSRPSELQHHLHLMLATAARVRHLGLRPLLLLAPGLSLPPRTELPAEIEVRQTVDPRDYATGALALAASGTVNLELAALGVPQVVCYATSATTYAVAKRLVRVPWLNPVNLVAAAAVVRERTQHDATPHNLAADLEATWQDRVAHRAAVRAVATRLREPAGLAHAAELVWSLP